MNYRIICVCLVLLLATAANADTPINVNVDGSQVKFGAVGPQSVQGRVLVPLRGVLERVGAFVSWESASRQVIAQKGDRDVVLRVGDKNATVNGQPVVMDVPAVIMAGTTMVPLRFLGEALGAEIKWNAATRTVDILTTGAAVVEPELYSFSHNKTGWLKAGDVLKVTMQGTAGAKASFMIPGVVKQVAMTETGAGNYVGEWTVPKDSPSISEASVIGTLVLNNISKLIQAATPVKIDVTPPVIRNLTPTPDSQSQQGNLNISAIWDDAKGSGINTDSAVFKVNGQDITADSSITQSFINYRPDKAIPAGDVSISLSVADNAGNRTEQTWKSSIVAAASVIKSFSYTADDNPTPGDSITAKMEGKTGGTASFWFVDAAGNKLRTQAMQETSPGVYTGEYIMRKGDDLKGAEVVGSLTLASGASYTLTAQKKIGGVAVSPDTPVIKKPAADSSVASPLTVTGTAPPNSQVQIKIEYVMSVLGTFGMKGTLAEQVIDVNDRGEFTSEPIDLSTLVKGKDTQYTLTAITVSANGKESEPTVVKFTKQ